MAKCRTCSNLINIDLDWKINLTEKKEDDNLMKYNYNYNQMLIYHTVPCSSCGRLTPSKSFHEKYCY